MIRLLLANRQQEPLIIYTDEFYSYDPLEVDEKFGRECVVHGDDEYADDTVHVNTCEASQKIASHSISARSNSDENFTTNPDEKRLNTLSKPRSEINSVPHKSVRVIILVTRIASRRGCSRSTDSLW
jgi:transposase-like protein